jgi:hypothetical protein
MHPSNAILLESNSHHDFDNLNWSIDAVNNVCAQFYLIPVMWNLRGQTCLQRYLYQSLNHNVMYPARPADGSELRFGQIDGEVAPEILPNPDFCNAHFAVHRLLFMSGASEVIGAGFDNEGYGYAIPSLGLSEPADQMFLECVSNRLHLVE